MSSVPSARKRLTRLRRAPCTPPAGLRWGQWASEKVTFADRPDGALGHYLHGFGQDLTGEVYVLTTDNLGPTGNTGRVYRLASHAGQLDPSASASADDDRIQVEGGGRARD